ncbi:MAG: hypothetical protein COT71_02205 [Candidatus Andersenbacteria bacterium CG10_big_fil_rev_8_21_14_0_10_54_11]|uniref:Uncharacterized protein n=1 Tax=Candidatus Andersenbacteria bacterium CG10_big_fil_rev_8_21_14_0_10_54_11 TaxID=1974485 RepID=A0A2M6WZC5_9BACT|nr:MAG: hypothetical protein COT71_02205 [Candidatus Andersenbacteria bacterium CG10_big_fil_rev_8_21_14_0_10_54_11]
MPKQSTAPVTKQDFEEAMHILAKSFERVATREDLKLFATKEDLERFATKEDLERFATKEDFERIEDTQHSMLKVLDSIEGRLKEMANHEERITRLEEQLFKLENQLRSLTSSR